MASTSRQRQCEAIREKAFVWERESLESVQSSFSFASLLFLLSSLILLARFINTLSHQVITGEAACQAVGERKAEEKSVFD